jgi:resuscitation-promoting factor RpfB
VRRAAQSAGSATAQGVGSAEDVGVSSSTLEAIAACESGGDSGAVNPAGYYGKYQFDLGTWQSVGGSGNPAQASEAEQDYRAAVLYSRAGASPWPVCGA